MLWLLSIAILVAALVAPVFAFVSFGRTGRLKREIAELRIELLLLRHRVTEGGPAAPGPAMGEEPSPGAEEPDEIAAEPPPVTPPEPPPATQPPPPPPGEEAAETAPEAPQGPLRPAADGQGALEETLTSRWLVWLGGATLALGGAFLVKYSIDEGLLGPTARVLAGVGLGLALLVAGEWLRRRPLERALAEIDPSYVPPAITAAGIFTLFASIYAGYVLYHLLSPLVAFLSLAGVAATAVALSLLQGPFMALLGLTGGFVTPLLVAADRPSAVALFTYLLALIAGSLAVVRYMGWRWLAWVTLGGAALWPLIWFATVWRPGDGKVLGIYLLAVFALFVFVRFRPRDEAPGDEAPDELPGLFRLDALEMSERIAWAAAAAVAVLTFILVRMDGYGTQSIVVLGVLGAFFMLVARRDAVFDSFPVMAAVLAALVLATWHMPRIIAERPHQYVGIPIVPPELAQFASVSATLAALFGVGAFVVMWGARRPALWASVSAATPVAILAIAYWRVKSFELDLAWAVVALGLAAVNLIIAERVARYRDKAGMNGALGAFGVATVAALSLAVTMSLGQAWLTVALAVQLPAIAWIEGQLRLPALRGVMVVLAFAVLIRLVFNHNILDYPMGRYPGVNWLLYGYGLPSIAFYTAARLLRRSKDDWIVALLEAGALVFLVLLISLEIRHLMADGPLDARRYGLAEQSLQSISWAAIALVLYVREGADGRVVLKWGWRILGGLAAAQVLLWQVLASNPLFTGEAIGSAPVFNILLLAYGAPAVFAASFALVARRRGDAAMVNGTGVLALFLGFVLLSLEIRHAFHGAVLSLGATTDGEWYTYSAGWLIYAAVLLALGIWRGATGLRYASLALVMLTVLKVFAFDMRELTGIFRALSFMGLGLTLIGVGYFYRRFVFPPASPPPSAAPE